MVECVMNSTLMIVHWLHIVLIVIAVVKIVVGLMVTVVLSFMMSRLLMAITI